MSIRSSASRDRGASKNRETYRAAFLHQVFEILAAGYSRLALARLVDAEEPAITGELVRCMRAYLEDAGAPPWAERYAVHDDPPVNREGLLGTARPRADIELESTQLRPRMRFPIEAKRLREEDRRCLSAYLGDDGLGCFLSGRYGRGQRDAGMLGYVQSGAPEDWARRIWNRLREREASYSGGSWQEVLLTEDRHCYRSEHERPEELGPLSVYHMLLHFGRAGTPI